MVNDAYLIFLALAAVFGIYWLYYALNHVGAGMPRDGLMRLGLGALGLSALATVFFLVWGFVG